MISKLTIFRKELSFKISFLKRFADTQFCTHNLILEDDWNDNSKCPKIIIALLALNHSSYNIKMILRS